MLGFRLKGGRGNSAGPPAADRECGSGFRQRWASLPAKTPCAALPAPGQPSADQRYNAAFKPRRPHAFSSVADLFSTRSPLAVTSRPSCPTPGCSAAAAPVLNSRTENGSHFKSGCFIRGRRAASRRRRLLFSFCHVLEQAACSSGAVFKREGVQQCGAWQRYFMLSPISRCSVCYCY
jgi:hypothetical protein